MKLTLNLTNKDLVFEFPQEDGLLVKMIIGLVELAGYQVADMEVKPLNREETPKRSGDVPPSNSQVN